VEHQHLVEKLNPLNIPSWKWEEISMDFISGLPSTFRDNETILVVVYQLMKIVHFILVKTTHHACDIAFIFI
jgi:hypothetical protein